MKKALVISILFLSSLGISAQRQNNFEKIKALKTAYITDKVGLTSKEAEVFWPVYNKFERELYQLKVKSRRKLMQEIKSKGGVNQLTETEADILLQRYKKLNENIFLKEQEKIRALEKVLDAKKLLKLYRAEETFKKELLNKLKQRRIQGN
jgi:hypothetical protein